LSRQTFKSAIEALPVVDWKATPAKHTDGDLVDAQLITCEGRLVGLLDGVGATMLLQGMESTRLLVAVSEWAQGLGVALHAGDHETSKHHLRELGEILSTVGAHFEESYARTAKATAHHDAVAPRKK